MTVRPAADKLAVAIANQEQAVAREMDTYAMRQRSLERAAARVGDAVATLDFLKGLRDG